MARKPMTVSLLIKYGLFTHMGNLLPRLHPSHPIDKCFHAAFSSNCEEKEKKKKNTLICLHPEDSLPQPTNCLVFNEISTQTGTSWDSLNNNNNKNGKFTLMLSFFKVNTLWFFKKLYFFIYFREEGEREKQKYQ